MAKRNPAVLGEWGPGTKRVIASESQWRKVYAWDRLAAKEGNRPRVFVNSMSDVFEDHPEVIQARIRLFQIINECRNLDFLLLTKRPENFGPIIGEYKTVGVSWDCNNFFGRWLDGRPPANIWFGVTVENQDYTSRISHLAKIPAAVRFLSMEPLLGNVDLFPWLQHGLIDWVIVGGESGAKESRPLNYAAVSNLHNQCIANKVPFFFKQWGDYLSFGQNYNGFKWNKGQIIAAVIDNKTYGRNKISREGLAVYVKVGKKAAGRLWRGETFDELPTPRKEVVTR